jgi:hypothetical protein
LFLCRYIEDGQFTQNTGNDLAKLYSKQPGLIPVDDFTQADRERVLELLLSQERVVSLIYAKTFPINPSITHKGAPMDNNANNSNNNNNATSNLANEFAQLMEDPDYPLSPTNPNNANPNNENRPGTTGGLAGQNNPNNNNNSGAGNNSNNNNNNSANNAKGGVSLPPVGGNQRGISR